MESRQPQYQPSYEGATTPMYYAPPLANQVNGQVCPSTCPLHLFDQLDQSIEKELALKNQQGLPLQVRALVAFWIPGYVLPGQRTLPSSLDIGTTISYQVNSDFELQTAVHSLVPNLGDALATSMFAQAGNEANYSQAGNVANYTQAGNEANYSQDGDAGDESQDGDEGDDSQDGDAGDESQDGDAGDESHAGDEGYDGPDYSQFDEEDGDDENYSDNGENHGDNGENHGDNGEDHGDSGVNNV